VLMAADDMTGHRIVQKLFSGVLWRAVFQGYFSSLHRAAAAAGGRWWRNR
jgi:hypothetical protein